MQQASESMKNELWDRLERVYINYTGSKQAEIPITKVEDFCSTVLGEQTQAEVDYVVKNMFRLDSDGSGAVDFFELANFLFKRHCGQMSLQKMHKDNKIQNQTERKINTQEFNILLNNAFSFLKLQCPPEVAQQIFRETDKDKDNLITYVEYFQVVEKYVLKSEFEYKEVEVPKVVEKVVPPQILRTSKLRTYIWSQLRKLYEAYVCGRVLNATDMDFRNLILSIVGDLSEAELAFIANGLFQLDKRTIEFIPFAMVFIYLIGELGLSRYARNHPKSKKFINRDEFVLIFKNSFKFLNVGKIKPQFLWMLFNKIDKNRDGLISYEEYLDWLKRFLALDNYYGDEYWVSPEDDGTNLDDMFIKEKPMPVTYVQKPAPKQRGGTNYRVNFVFSDLEFAEKVRKQCYYLLSKFDYNHNQLLEPNEVHAALTQLLKEDELELEYVTRNVFRYDIHENNKVTFDQMTDFSVEQHFGEMAIQRLHRKCYYSRGAERIMNRDEFGRTLNHALNFIEMQATPNQLDVLFKQIDLQRKGWITYEIYFLFLKYYFGSLSLAAMKTNYEVGPVELSPDELFLNSLKGLSALDKFIKLLIDQLRLLCLQYDFNKNLVFETDEIEAILANVFKMNNNEINYVMQNYFKFYTRNNGAVSYEELIAIILEIYFIELYFRRKHSSTNQGAWRNKKISLNDFVNMVNEAVFFLKHKPTKEDLTTIFKMLDTDRDGYITFDQYMAFIKKYLGKGLEIIGEEPVKAVKAEVVVPADVSEEEVGFVQAIWGELKHYFDIYDKGGKGFLSKDQLKQFSIEVLKESAQKELDYIFWNLFRVDVDGNNEIEFQEFAPFILNHAGEIALQRFHMHQIKGKNSLVEDEMFIVIGNAYSFLSSMPKSQGVVRIIFNRLKKGPTVPYGGFLGWINRAVSKKFR